MSTTARRWAFCPPAPSALLAAADLPPLLAQLLFNRGIVAPEAMRAFLADPPPRTADPQLMHGMQPAIDRLIETARKHELVAIYGDYDVDGVTSAALLSETFAAVGMTYLTHIPTRSEGYGLRGNALQDLATRGVGLVVTVDCGINSCAEVDLARQLGVDVIVTDHHVVEGPTPSAVAVINPRQTGCDYPFKELAAVGIAFKVAQALLRRLPVMDGRSRLAVATRLLDFVAIGTVGDVAPLVGENRALLRHGLGALNQSQRPGLLALIRSAGLSPGLISADNIGFALAPRLNAVGRLRDGLAAYRLLLSESAEEASTLAAELEAANQLRQRLTAEILDSARAQVLGSGHLEKLLVVAGADFHPGVVGLVAGRLAEEFHRPALVVELGENECRGSARSVEGFNVALALAHCGDLLTRGGGHAMAAGFSVRSENWEPLRLRLREYADQRLDDAQLAPRLVVDAELPLHAVDDGVYPLIQRLAPFGHGNPPPLFLARGARVMEARPVGRNGGRHLRLTLHDGTRFRPAVAFGFGHAADQVAGRIDIVYTLERNDWGGRQTLECHVRDWRNAD